MKTIIEKIEDFKKTNGYNPSPIILDLFYQLCKEVAMTQEEFFRINPEGFAKVMRRFWLNNLDLEERRYSSKDELQQSFEKYVKFKFETFHKHKFIFWAGQYEGNACMLPVPTYVYRHILDEPFFSTANAHFSDDSIISAMFTSFKIDGLEIVRPTFRSIKIDYNKLVVTEIVTSYKFHRYWGTEPHVDLSRVAPLTEEILQKLR
jgi:hypothetical protein